jgi:hypothetical protein
VAVPVVLHSLRTASTDRRRAGHGWSRPRSPTGCPPRLAARPTASLRPFLPGTGQRRSWGHPGHAPPALNVDSALVAFTAGFRSPVEAAARPGSYSPGGYSPGRRRIRAETQDAQSACALQARWAAEGTAGRRWSPLRGEAPASSNTSDCPARAARTIIESHARDTQTGQRDPSCRCPQGESAACRLGAGGPPRPGHGVSAVSLLDELTVTPADRTSVTVSGEGGLVVPLGPANPRRGSSGSRATGPCGKGAAGYGSIRKRSSPQAGGRAPCRRRTPCNELW